MHVFHRSLRRCFGSWAIFAFLLLLTDYVAAQDAKVALLVGVEKYERRGFSNLQFAEDDMLALADKLKAQGFEVTTLLGSGEGAAKADGKTIEETLRKSFIPRLKQLKKEDICLIAMAGHGRHGSVVTQGSKVEDHFFCPCDAHDTDTSTWFSISGLIQKIESESSSERNLILIDACRDNPSRGRGVDGTGMSLNKEAVAVLFASSYNEQAYEPTELKHGLFTYYVLEALSGEAKNFDNEVTWDSLVDYVKGRVERKSEELLKDKQVGGIQRPNAMGNLRGRSPVLASVDRVKPAESPSKTMTNKLGMKLVRIEAGEFMMGNEDSVDELMKLFPYAKKEWFEDATKRHRVKITQPYYLGAHEVTVGQFRRFVEATGYKTEAESDGKGGYGIKSDGTFEQSPSYTWKNPGFSQSEDHPVVNVSWNDAVEFCKWLSREEGKPYRLPTEAEWEYACRAGTKTRYWHGSEPEGLTSIDNVADATSKSKYSIFTNTLASSDKHAVTAPRGSFRSNAWGLYDMHGNVSEWCGDWYGEYPTSAVSDPTGPANGSNRMLRGGSWLDNAGHCRSAFRNFGTPGYRNNYLGFRVAVGR